MQSTAYLTGKQADLCVSGMEKLASDSPIKEVEHHPCPLAQDKPCKPYGRLYVNRDESDEFCAFIFRTSGFNSIWDLAARLSYDHAAGLLSCLLL
jgi:hypothetical protein